MLLCQFCRGRICGRGDLALGNLRVKIPGFQVEGDSTYQDSEGPCWGWPLACVAGEFQGLRTGLG